MKTLSSISVIITLSILSTSAFSADWTPYLNSLKNSCDMSGIEKALGKVSINWDKRTYNINQLPKNLKNDIVKYDFDNEKFILKNATAFGYPLKAISYHSEMGDADPSVYLAFGSDKFVALLSQFTITDGKRTEKAGSNKYWINIGIHKQRGDDYQFITNKTHNLPYYPNAHKEFLFALWYLPTLNDKDSWVTEDRSRYDAMYQKLNPKFKQHQLPIVKKLIQDNNKRAEPYGTKVYITNSTGYEEWHDGSGYDILEFNKTNKTISCYGGHYGDVVTPD